MFTLPGPGLQHGGTTFHRSEISFPEPKVHHLFFGSGSTKSMVKLRFPGFTHEIGTRYSNSRLATAGLSPTGPKRNTRSQNGIEEDMPLLCSPPMNRAGGMSKERLCSPQVKSW